MPDDDEPQPGVVQITGVQEVAPDLVVAPNRHADLVPNIGVIGSSHSVLAVETGMGPRNAEKVLTFAVDQAKGRRLDLATTYFYSEHAFGAQVFAEPATYVVNRAQADDLATRGAGYLEMFRGWATGWTASWRASSWSLRTSTTTAPTILTSAAGSCTCGPSAGDTPGATRSSRSPAPG